MKKRIILLVLIFLFIHIIYSQLNIYHMNELSLRTLQREIQFTCDYFYRNEEDIDYAELKQMMSLIHGSIPNGNISKPIFKSRLYDIFKDFDLTLLKLSSNFLNEANDNQVIDALMAINLELKQMVKDKDFYTINQEAYDKITEEIEKLNSILNET